VFTIKHLADVAGQRIFADFGTFMLERTIKTFIQLDDTVVRNDEFEGVSVKKGYAHGCDRRHGKIAKLIDLEIRLGSSYLH